MALNIPGLSTTQVNRLEGIVFGAVVGLVGGVISAVWQAAIYPAFMSGHPDFASINWQYPLFTALGIGLPVCGARILDGFEKILTGTIDNTIPPNVLVSGVTTDAPGVRADIAHPDLPPPPSPVPVDRQQPPSNPVPPTP